MTKTRKRVWANLLTVGGLLAALVYAGTVLTTAAGTGLYPASRWARVAREQARAERLEAQLRETVRRMAARDEVVEAVCAGRLTLREAVARFRELDAGCPEPRREILTLTSRKLDPQGRNVSYEECLCRNILEYVRRAQTVEDPNHPDPDTADVIPRLEEEFRQLVQAGTLDLPE